MSVALATRGYIVPPDPPDVIEVEGEVEVVAEIDGEVEVGD